MDPVQLRERELVAAHLSAPRPAPARVDPVTVVMVAVAAVVLCAVFLVSSTASPLARTEASGSASLAVFGGVELPVLRLTYQERTVAYLDRAQPPVLRAAAVDVDPGVEHLAAVASMHRLVCEALFVGGYTRLGTDPRCVSHPPESHTHGVIQGRSSELAEALAMVSYLTGSTDGPLVAASGVVEPTIPGQGRVFDVLGMEHKAAAAKAAGAEILVVASANAHTAQLHAPGVDVVAVDTLEEAVAVFCASRTHGCDPPPTPK